MTWTSWMTWIFFKVNYSAYLNFHIWI